MREAFRFAASSLKALSLVEGFFAYFLGSRSKRRPDREEKHTIVSVSEQGFGQKMLNWPDIVDEGVVNLSISRLSSVRSRLAVSLGART